MATTQDNATEDSQRVIAELQQKLDAALTQKAALAEVLDVINQSPGDPVPVFEAILEKAHRLCGSAVGAVHLYDGKYIRVVATRGFPDEYDAMLRRPFSPSSPHQMLIRGDRLVHTPDVRTTELMKRPFVEQTGVRTVLAVPLRKDGTYLGCITANRLEVSPFSEDEIAQLESFASQAVIALENTRLITEQREALEQQTATAEVLQVINSSPGNLEPVFDAMLDKAMKLCEAACGGLFTYDGERFHTVAARGVPVAMAQFRAMHPPTPRMGNVKQLLETRRPVHVLDWMDEDAYLSGDVDARAIVELGGARTNLLVPLLRDECMVGFFGIYRQEVRQFSDRQIALLQNFAAQAVIAMENARLLGELQERTVALAERNSEYGERIEQQAATIDVLKAMSASLDDTQPVFDLIARQAQKLCNCRSAGVFEYDGELVHIRSIFGADDMKGYAKYKAAFPMKPTRGTIVCQTILDKRIIHIRDMLSEPELLPMVRELDIKSILSIPLLRDDTVIGVFNVNTTQPGGFTDSQAALVQTFAEQAVIAITSVANFRALRERTAELTRSVAELQALEEVLRAVNSSLELETVLSTIISRAVQLSDADEGTIYEFEDAEQVFVPKSAYGMTEERVTALRDRRIRIGETPLGNSAAMRAPLHIYGSRELVEDGVHALLAVPLLRDDKVLGGLVIRRRTVGGFAPTVPTLLQTFSGQAVLAIENARLFQEAGRARTVAEVALADLRRTQDRLVQTEKMASLGQLTAGIAHEIKNPLNFVNNFSDLSVDLLNELNEAVAPGKLAVADSLRAEIDDITTTLKGNLEKIAEHGRRADSIVKNMLLHSRTGPSEHRAFDLNTVVEEALNLAYHGARAETPGFNITMEKDLDPKAGTVDLYPQEFIRVMLNLIGNGFYAARNRANQHTNPNYEPTLRLTTRGLDELVEIRVRDNGTGINDAVRDKIFEPFFTTKPSGEGTGLGLSLSYDIVVKQHGGRLTVDSQIDTFTEFTITLPRRTASSEGGTP